MLKLVMERGDHPGMEYILEDGEIFIGRSRECQIHLAANDVSGRHARLLVEGERVTVENLGKIPCRLGRKPVAGVAPMSPGQQLLIGAHAVLRLESAENTLAENGLQTDNRTQVMRTRVITPEEIERLQAIEQRKLRNRVVMVLSVGIPILILLAYLWHHMTLPPEAVIGWPRNSAGEFLNEVVPSPFKSYDSGGYDLVLPGGWPRNETSSVQGGYQIETRIGLKRDVRLRLVLHEEEDASLLVMDRETALKEWMQRILREDNSWSFGRISKLEFLGGENGLPCIFVPYERVDGNTWSGRARMFRHGRRRVVLCIETPRADRARAVNIMRYPIFKIARGFELSHWEGAAELPRTDASALLRRVQPELTRVAPQTWGNLESLLKDALIKAAYTGNAAVEQEALQELVRLRQTTTVWFNSQRLARLNAEQCGEKQRAERIADLCKAVFSNPEDRRYALVRGARW